MKDNGMNSPVFRIRLPKWAIFVVLTVIVLAIGAIVTLAFLPQQQDRQQSAVGSLVVGKPAPDFTLPTLDGTEVSLSQLRGQPVLINFWASWCAPCLAELPGIQKLYQEMNKDGLEVLAVNVDENPEKEIPKVIQRLGLNLPIYTDKNAELSEMFEVSAIPFTIVTNRKHEIIWAESGEKDWFSEKVIQEIGTLLKDK